MADDMAVIYRRYRPEIYWSKVIKSKHKNYSRHSTDEKTTKRFSNVYEPCSNATLKKSKSSFRQWQDIIITVKQNTRKHKRKKSNGQQIPRRPQLSAKRSTRLTTDEYLKILTKKCSTPIKHDVEDDSSHGMKRTHSDTQLNTSTPYQTKFIVNTLLLDPDILQPERQHVLNHPLMQARLRIYRCQMSTTEESCCCSCNSDAMFEVMKSLYDCYKKKNCDHCNCILCGHLSKEERKLGEARKPLASVGVETDTAKLLRKDGLKKANEAVSEKSLIANMKKTAAPKEVSGLSSRKSTKAKAIGLLTPLEGKTPEQREKILRGLALSGLPLPEAKTPSLKKLIQKVKKDLGLPPTPKTAAEQEKQDKAAKLGFFLPLEGKSKPEKEKILQTWNEMEIELPEGRSRSEKSLIAKIKAGPKELALSQSENLAKAKAAGLPAGTKEPEKIIVAKVAEESKAPLPLKVDNKATPSVVSSASEKQRRAKAAGLKTTLGSDSEKLRRAKAAGLLTTLDNKTPEQKEKILRSLAMMELPLPEGKTPSVIKLLRKVRNELGMPPEPKNIAERDKYNKAQAARLIKPLEGKTPAEKEIILRALVDKSIPLPIGRTPSEKALIKKILAGTKQIPSAEKVASEKLRKATLAGLSIPLQGKTPDQKEKVLRDIAMHLRPLPEGMTPSEIKLIDKVRKDLGLPPTPKTDADKDKYAKAQVAGLIVPLEAKTPEQKERILKKLAEKNIPLPEGRTASEKLLIKKIQAESVSYKAKMGSERLRKVKAAGLAVSLTGKSPEQKTKILHNLANRGYPLPEGKTASEKALIDSVRKILDERTAKNITQGKGPSDECICHILAPESVSKARKSKSAGVVTPKKSKFSGREVKAKAPKAITTPLDGKTSLQKETILKKMTEAGLPLPKGKTPSEKTIIAKLATKPSKTQPAKLREATGLLTPLKGKRPEEQEKILKGLIKAGLPLPDGTTPSEKALIKKVKDEIDVGKKSKSATALTKLPGKSLVRTVSSGVPAKIQSANLRKTAGLLTPLKGKDPKTQEQILKRLLKAGLPLPKGTTPSEEALIKRIQDEFNAAKKVEIRREKASGLVSPLKGKILEEKRKTVTDLIQAALPPPKVTTPSEKEMVKKIKTDVSLKSKSVKKAKAAKAPAKAGLPVPEGGDTRSKKRIRKSKVTQAAVGAGIQEEIQEIVRTDKCDAACGCEKKKIRFKHSYVKIRVTSPDISSFCPCPNECIPGVKSGVFIDSEGIKVTVGRSVGIPSYKVLPKIRERFSRYSKRSNSSFYPDSDECVPEGESGMFTNNEGSKVTVGRSVGIPAYKVYPQKRKRFSRYSKRSNSSFCPDSDECVPEGECGMFTNNEGSKVTVGSVGIPSCKVLPQIRKRFLRYSKRSNSSFCPDSDECVPEGECGIFTNKEGIKVTVGSVGIPSYTVHPEITKRNSHENKRSLQTFKESPLPLKISLMGSDCATDDLNSSKSTVYIFNSESDVSISEIERLLRLTLNNDNLKKEFKFKTSGEKKPVSYIYSSWYFDRSGDFRSSLQIAPSTLNLSTSSVRLLYTNTIYKAESSLNHMSNLAISMTTYNMYDSNMLSKVSYLENHLKYSSQSIKTPLSTERVDDMGSTSTKPRKSQYYVTYSNRKIDISNYLGEFISHLVAKGALSRASLRSRNAERGIKRKMLELMQKALSNKTLSTSSAFMGISSSGHGDSSQLHVTDTLSNLPHSEPSSPLLTNNRPYISRLALNILECAKFISKAEAQKDLWKRKRVEAVSRLRNMAHKLLLQIQNTWVRTSNKYTSSTMASQEQKHVEHTVKKTGVLCRKRMASRGNREAYQTKHIDTSHSFISPSSYCPSTSTVSATPQIHVKSQVTTNNPVSNVEEILSSIKTDNGPVKVRKMCTFAKRVGEMDWNSPSFCIHRASTGVFW